MQLDNFTFERADIMNKLAMERVMNWQRIGSLPEGHSIALMKTGKRVLEGLKESDTEPETSDITRADIQDVPGPGESSESRSSEEGNEPLDGAVENGHESESSGVLIGTDDCETPPKAPATPIIENPEVDLEAEPKS